MKRGIKAWSASLAPAMSRGWIRHRRTILRLVLVIMVLVAILKVGSGLQRLIFEPERIGAGDLKSRLREVQTWFSGMPVYGVIKPAVYPPASYSLLWPLLGWMEFSTVRWFWAFISLAGLGWLSFIMVRESGAESRLERGFVALMPFSMNATFVALGTGQLIPYVLPVLLTGLLLLHRGVRDWKEGLAVVILILVALVSPTITAPFFWMVLFAPRNWRPALFVIIGYIGLTFLAASFQDVDPVTLLRQWMERGKAGVVYGSSRVSGNIHSQLASHQLQQWNVPSSLIILAAHGVWICRYRNIDVWTLLGVSALVARFWTYHGTYDNLLILLTAVALFRIARQGSPGNGWSVTAGVLLVVTWVFMIAPNRIFIFWPPWGPLFNKAPSVWPPWDFLFKTGQSMAWLADFLFLFIWAEKNRKSNVRFAPESSSSLMGH